MPNLHYYVDIVEYITISDKFNGILEIFIDLLNSSKVSKNMVKSLSCTMQDIDTALSSNKRLVCAKNGYTRKVGGSIEYLNMNLAKTRVTMISNDITSKDEEFEYVTNDFIHNLNLALKSFGLETSSQIIRVSMDMYHYTVKVTDFISIDIDIHIPAEFDPEDTNTEAYYNTLWIEFSLDLGNDSVIH